MSVDEKGKLKKNETQFGDSTEIGKAVKKGDWNKYRIVAKGFHFHHFINDIKTTELIDNDLKLVVRTGYLLFNYMPAPHESLF